MPRPPFGTTAALILAGALGAGCTESAAEEAQRPAPLPPPAAQDAPPAPAPDAPHGTRPMDDATVRALAEEVARLKAEIARMRAEQPAAAEPPAPAAPAAQAAPLAPAPAPAEPAAAPPAEERVVERVIEREVPVVVEREVPVVVEREVVREVPVVQTVVETVVYEEVVYRDVRCHQYVPCGHVHSIGCGHHYYGCACHPWYYDLSGGLDITFVWYDVDDHHRPCPTPRGRYRAGYRDGYRDGRNDGDFHHAYAPRPLPARSPAAPVSRGAPPAARESRPFAAPTADRGARERPPASTLVGRDGAAPSVAPRAPAQPSGAHARDRATEPVRPDRTPDAPSARRDRPSVADRPEVRDRPRDVVRETPRAPAPEIVPVRPERAPTVPAPAPTRVREPGRTDAPDIDEIRRRRDAGPPRIERRPEPPVRRPPEGRAPGRRAPDRRGDDEDTPPAPHHGGGRRR